MTKHQRNRYESEIANDEDMRPDWETPCDICGQVPTVPLTGLCGPCTFGEAKTVGGNW